MFTKTPDVQTEIAPAPAEKRASRGFATMNPTLLHEIARRGGKAAHEAGTAHEFTTDEARIAGRKGGHAARRAKRAADSRLSAPAVSS